MVDHLDVFFIVAAVLSTCVTCDCAKVPINCAQEEGQRSRKEKNPRSPSSTAALADGVWVVDCGSSHDATSGIEAPEPSWRSVLSRFSSAQAHMSINSLNVLFIYSRRVTARY